jgi:hypothetical protein
MQLKGLLGEVSLCDYDAPWPYSQFIITDPWLESEKCMEQHRKRAHEDEISPFIFSSFISLGQVSFGKVLFRNTSNPKVLKFTFMVDGYK